MCTQEYPCVCAYALYMHRQNQSTTFSAASGGGGWKENKPCARASRGEQWGDVSVGLYLLRWTRALDMGLVVSPCGAPEMLKGNQVCTVSAAGRARARSARLGCVAGSLGTLPSTRILAGSLMNPCCILAASSPTFPCLQTSLLRPVALLPRCLGKRSIRKAERCTCARGAVFLFGVLPRFFHPGEYLLGETGVCTEVGFAGGSFTAPRLVIAVAAGAVGSRVWGRRDGGSRMVLLC